MTEVTEEMKRRITELCAQPVSKDEYDSWAREVPDFAKECSYRPEAAEDRRGV